MDMHELSGHLERIIAQARTAVLATVDGEGRPHMRWMTPTVLHGREGAIYAITSPNFAKVAHLDTHSQVEWMAQSPDLTEIVNVAGRINMVDTPSLKAEIAEQIGRHLTVFWTLNAEQTDMLVLETIIDSATVFAPMTGHRDTLTTG